MKNRLFALALAGLYFLLHLAPLSAQNTLSISGPLSVCAGTCNMYQAFISPNSNFPPPLKYQWVWTGPGVTSSTYSQDSSTVTICFLTPGSYTIMLTVINANGQKQTTEISVFVLPYADVQIISENTAFCNTDSVSIDPDNQFCEKVCPNSTVTYYINNVPTLPGGLYAEVIWNVAGAQSYTENPPNKRSVTVHWGNTGTGSVSVSVATGSGTSNYCGGEDARCITIVQQPQADFVTDPAPDTPDTLRVCKGQTVWFENQSQYADSYDWFFSDDASSTTETNPKHQYFNPGVYRVQLIARSACLCRDTTETIVEVLDADAASINCVGEVCPGTVVTYTAGANCSDITWAASPNGAVLSGGTPGSDSITVQWGAGPVGLLTLSDYTCTGATCPQPTVIRVPIIDDNAEIRGAERVCPDAEEIYAIGPFGGTGFVWSLTGGGTIVDGQGTNQITVRWSSVPNPNTNYWISVIYDNCYLGCGGKDSIPVRIASPFVINGPVESCVSGAANFTSRLTYNNFNLPCNWTLQAPDGTEVWKSPAPTANVNVSFVNGPGLYRLFAAPNNPLLSCTDQAEWAVNVPPPPAAPAGIDGPGLICTNQLFNYAVTGVPASANIQWTITNGPGAPIVALGPTLALAWNTSGPYQLKVEQVSADGLGCLSDPVVLNPQTVNTLPINGPATLCINSTEVYSVSPITGMDYFWSLQPASAGTIAKGQGTNEVEIFWQTAGNHQMVLSICGNNSTKNVTVANPPAPVVNYPVELCPGNTALVKTATAFATYNWAKADGTLLSAAATLGLGPGNYVVTVTDASGCASHAVFTIQTAPTPNLTVSTADPTIFCNNSQTVTMVALTNSTGNLNYQWFQNGTPLGVNAAVYSTNQYGNYTVQATNAAGCTATAGPIAIIEDCGGGGGGGFPGGGAIECPPGSINLQIVPTTRCDSFQFQASGPNYLAGSAQWFFGQSGAAQTGVAAGDVAPFTFPNAGKYVVALFVQLTTGGVCRVVDSLPVEAVAAFSALPKCPGSASGFDEHSAFLPGSGISAWAWDFGDPASGASNTASVRVPVHTYATGGAYPVTLTITANSGCTSSVTKPANIPVPLPPVFPPPAGACSGNAIKFTATGPNISWNFGDPASGALNLAAGPTAYHKYAPGSYTVTATSSDNAGCTATATQTANPQPGSLSGAVTPTNPPAVCEGSSVLLTAPPGAAGYLWSDTSMTSTILAEHKGLYTVTMTDANGCTYTPPPVYVDITPGPDALIKALITNSTGQVIGTSYPAYTVCYGDDVRLFVESPGGYTYTWSTGTTTVTEEFSSSRGNLLTVGAHLYTVTVTDLATGCTAVTDPFLVTVNPTPTGININSSAAPACAGAPNTLNYSGPTQPNWQIVWNTGQTDLPLVTNNPGAYFLRVTNEFGCSERSNVLTILPGPNVQALPSGCQTRCKPDTICLPPLPNITAWQWYFNGAPLPGATGPSFVPQQSGTYWAQLTDAIGCTNKSGELTLNLLDGFGKILGQVWSDVNDNGVIDAGDTLVSGIPVELFQNGTAAGATQSGTAGDFAFPNILSTNYSVEIDPAALPYGWQIVIGQKPAVLSGCDAQTQVSLLLKAICQTVLGSTLQLGACPGTTYSYNGVSLAIGETQTFTLATPAGCDSMVTVTVEALPVTTGNLSVSACAGSSYDYNGTAIPAGSSQQFMLQNYLGCDSVLTVDVAAVPVSTGALGVSACAGSSYDYNGTAIPAGSSQQFMLQNYLGCDSVVTVSVTAIPASTGAVNASACAGSSYDYNGTAIPAGSSQQFMLQNYLGCDSVVTVTVATIQASTGALNVSACPGTSYDYNGTAIPAGSSQQFMLQNYLGCDSVVTVTVAALPVSTGALNVSACAGAAYDYNGTAVPAGSSQTFMLQNYLGCDSMLTVNVAAIPPSSGTFSAVVCAGQTFTYNGTVMQPGQTQQFTLQNYLGCDSVVTVTVSALPTPTSTLPVSLCPGETFTYQGVGLQTGQSQQFTLQNAIGCDSLVTVTVTALTTSAETQTVTICPNETFLYAGVALKPGETHDFHFTNSEGCDSTVTVVVAAFPEATFKLAMSPACTNGGNGSLAVQNPAGGLPPYRYSLDGTAFQDELEFHNLKPGAYTVWLEDSNGCLFQRDTTVPARLPLNLTLDAAELPCDSGGVQLNPVVSGDSTSLVYLWSTGAKTPAITVYDPGPVWVEVSNLCETLRRDVDVEWAGLGTGFSYVYVPNVFAPLSTDPDNAVFRPYFAPGLTLRNYKFEVYNRWGNLMFRTHDTADGWTGPFRQQDMQPGVYVWYLVVDAVFCGKERHLRLEGDVTIVR